MKLLNDIIEAKRRGKPYPIAVYGAEYHLCMDDGTAKLFLSYWYQEEKPFQITIRNAKQGVEGCTVISFKDVAGNSMRLLELAHTECKAKIYGKIEI